MKRGEIRRKILGAATYALALSLMRPAAAQSERKLRRLGMLLLDPVTPDALIVPSIIARLAELGWIENRTLVVERASADGDSRRLPELAQALLRSRPDVIWVDDFQSALAAGRATSTIPIVFWGISEPGELGLIESYARPGRNLTGVANNFGQGVYSKRLTMLKEIVPKARRLGWLFPVDVITDANGKVGGFDAYEADARRAGFDPVIYLVKERDDLNPMFRDMLRRRTEAVSVGVSSTLWKHRQSIVDFAITNRLPSAYVNDAYVDAGGLLSYGPDWLGTARISADYVDRMLRGAHPATTPVEQSKRFITVINLKTAKLLGLTIPPSVLVQADRVIG